MIDRLFVALLVALTLWGAAASAQLTLTGAGQRTNGSGNTCDPNFSGVVLLVGNDNVSSGTTTFTDQSNSAHSVTIRSGSIAYSNITAPTGMTTSINIPGSGALLQSANSADWQFGSGNFTIEAYFNPTSVSVTQDIIDTLDNGSGFDEFQVYLNSSTSAGLASENGTAWNVNVTKGNVTVAAWHHLAFYRTGSSFYIALDGAVSSVSTDSNSLLATTDDLLIGAVSGGSQSFTGYLASIRITKGVARYGSSNFTPPSLPFPHC
jgi:hypothetical protein